MEDSITSSWVCSHCGTTNWGSYCSACGRARPSYDRPPERPEPLDEEAIVRNAHKASISRMRQSIPFFFLSTLIITVLTFLFGFLGGLLSPILGVIFLLLFQLFLGNLMSFGLYVAGLRLCRDKPLSLSTLFEGFHDYGRILCGMFWFHFRNCVWILIPISLMILTGLMSAATFLVPLAYIPVVLLQILTVAGWGLFLNRVISYMFAPYLLYDRHNLSAEQAIQASIQLTRGHKMEIWIRSIKLIGWFLLNLLSSGLVGVLYYYAYDSALWAGFYDACARKTTRRPLRADPPRREYSPAPSLSDDHKFDPPPPL